MNPESLQFEIGQEAESRSFIEGFRGAWFRCKIKNMGMQKGQYGYFLEFYDFPDEEVTWTQLYQKAPHRSKAELMVRPAFPPILRESECPDSYPKSDVVVVVEDDWEVGDLVDWWSDGCYWSGRVTKLLENNKVEMKLPEPPIGEGKTYKVFYKDLRPSLDWHLEHGWTVPISREHGSSQYCARLVQPYLQDENDLYIPDENGIPDDVPIVPEKSSSKPSQCTSPNAGDKALGKESSKKESSSMVGRSETVESTIMEIEELANKVRWLKGLLLRCDLSDPVKPYWKLLENSGPPSK